MKITLDLDQLLAEGKLSAEECERLRELGGQATGSLAFSILISFGVVAVGGAVLALVPTPVTAITLGLVIAGVGAFLARILPTQWRLLCGTCTLVGALMLGGGIIAQGHGEPVTFLTTAVIFAIAAAFTRSALLSVLAIVVSSPALGSGTEYEHAAYSLVVERPLATILIYSIVGVGAYALSTVLPAAYRRVAVAAAAASAFIVNFGFWVGSLWGNGRSEDAAIVSDESFAVVWAIALVGTGIWAWRNNRRWLLNLAAVFAGIHFYTQWFERLHASPATVLLAGLLTLAMAFALRHANVAMTSASSPSA